MLAANIPEIGNRGGEIIVWPNRIAIKGAPAS
jgi:hypothetical protein